MCWIKSCPLAVGRKRGHFRGDLRDEFTGLLKLDLFNGLTK